MEKQAPVVRFQESLGSIIADAAVASKSRSRTCFSQPET